MCDKTHNLRTTPDRLSVIAGIIQILRLVRHMLRLAPTLAEREVIGERIPRTHWVSVHEYVMQ
jgi:hypothetical protein